MPDPIKPKDVPNDKGSYVIIDNKVWPLLRHPTDFAVEEDCNIVQDRISSLDSKPQAVVKQFATRMSRVSIDSQEDAREKDTLPQQRDDLMKSIRQQLLAHHIYQLEGIDEEIKITDRIILGLRDNDPEELLKILQEHKLVLEDRDEGTCLLRVTGFSNSNPVKIANEIFQRDGVESCVPEILFPMKASNAPAVVPDLSALGDEHGLLREQWYLTTNFFSSDDDLVKLNASINVYQAWTLVPGFGKPEVVIAVIDDGYDLEHPAFSKTPIRNPLDFAISGVSDPNPEPGGADNHGTCVASLAVASADHILGVAPGCALQPIRIKFHPDIAPEDVLQALEEANKTADIVNCSFGTGLSGFPFMKSNKRFVDKVRKMIATGGKERRGLIIVFAAGNDNGPIYLSGEENKNGIKHVVSNITGFAEKAKPAGTDVFGGYPEIPGVIVVAAISSRTRKASYSNWGKQLTVTAPSDGGEEAARIITANNQIGKGNPLPSLNSRPNLDVSNYTDRFGGTSAAAPIVSGVIGLMLSAKQNLTPQDVCKILKETADKDLDLTLDEDEALNLQGLPVGFVDGKHSIIFGGGKVNAARAVQAVLDLNHWHCLLSASRELFKR